MRFMVMHKNDPHTEAGELPPPALMAEMGAFIMEHAQAGRLLGGEGLSGSRTRTRLTFRDGEAQRYGKLLGDCEFELGPVNEPWDSA